MVTQSVMNRQANKSPKINDKMLEMTVLEQRCFQISSYSLFLPAS